MVTKWLQSGYKIITIYRKHLKNLLTYCIIITEVRPHTETNIKTKIKTEVIKMDERTIMLNKGVLIMERDVKIYNLRVKNLKSILN